MQLLKKWSFLLIGALGALCLGGCRKYTEGPATIGGTPAYLRVFNVVPFSLTPINSSGNIPFFTFLFDPKTDKAGIPSGADIVGDWLGTRQIYCSSTGLSEGNSIGAAIDTTVKYNITYEYPGAAHVLTAPNINGFDLSAWAQVPPGKHRVLFIARPQTNTAFADLSATIRSNIVIDTTIDLEPGEVYTLEAVGKDEDHNLYGAYIRKEQFIHQTFSDSNMYVGFFNLSGIHSAYSGNQYSPTYSDYPDSLRLACSYNVLDDITYQTSMSTPSSLVYNYNPVPGFSKTVMGILPAHMSTTTTYYPLPILPNSAYFDAQGLFRDFRAVPLPNTQTPPPGTYGTLPWVSFFLSDATQPVSNNYGHELDCNASPATINDIPRYMLSALIPPQLTQEMATQSLFSNVSGSMKAYSCLNIMEISYNTVYCMQIQPAFYNTTN